MRQRAAPPSRCSPSPPPPSYSPSPLSSCSPPRPRVPSTSSTGEPAHRVRSYSIAGNTKILEGSISAPEIVSASGPVRLTRYSEVSADLEDITRNEADSIFGETYSQIVTKAVEGAEKLQEFLGADEAAVSASWSGSGTVASQLKVVANIIGARRLTASEREVFFIRYGGWWV